MLNAFVIAGHFNQGQTDIHIFNRDLSNLPLAHFNLPGGGSADGPGLVGTPDRRSLASVEAGRVPLEIIRAVDTDGDYTGAINPNNWELAYHGQDILVSEVKDGSRLFDWSEVLRGYGFSDRSLLTMNQKKRIQIEREALFSHFTISILPLNEEVEKYFPVFDTLTAWNANQAATATKAVQTTNSPGAFRTMKGNLWPISCMSAVTANLDQLSFIPVAQWNTLQVQDDLNRNR